MAKSQNSSGKKSRKDRIAEKRAEHAKRAQDSRTLRNTPNAYKAVITLKSEGFLLGGTRVHESSPFAEERDAIAFALQSRQVNLDRPGYYQADIETKIVPVFSRNPIPEQKYLNRPQSGQKEGKTPYEY